jgi:pimeloyl-ACP methyl ester carboxylesterase
MFCPDGQATFGAGVRLITVDRPGYGGSDPVPDPSLSGFATDLGRLADHLWLGQFAIVGWSGGGLYAAACAAQLGERVSALGLVAVPAPDDEVSWLPPETTDLGRVARVDPQRALATLADTNAPLAAEPDRAGDHWNSPSDALTRRQPGVEDALHAMWREGLRHGAEGLGADVVAGLRPWDFAPAGLTTPACLFYGDDDPVVGVTHGRWWEQTLPNARLSVIAGGHLIPLAAWSEILGGLQP